MVFFKLSPFVILGVLYVSYTYAAPEPPVYKHTTHHLRHIGRDLKVETFHPSSDYKTFGAGIELPESLQAESIEQQSVAFVSSQLNVDSSKVAFKSGHATDVGRVGYMKQMHDGVPFINAVANVAFKDNKVVAFGQSFVDTQSIAPSIPTIDVKTVTPKIEASLEGTSNDIEPTLAYLALQDGRVALVHVFQVQNKEAGTWYEAYVNAHSGELLSVTDFVAKATYKVLPVWKQDITEGLETLVNPQNVASSPGGWHSTGAAVPESAGNNVLAYKYHFDATTTEAQFQTTYNPSEESDTANNLDAARTNGFYIANTYHDVLYQYGFTETAFNFQNDNFGKGGAGGDRVLMSIQDPSRTDDAQFATPPDGQSGVCYMYIFTYTDPTRDGVMENDIPIHEMTHGLSNRLTGGGTATCLQTLESGGMGEGWSDTVANWFAHSNSSQITDFVVGQWATDDPTGIRSFPYSTSTDVNPLKYSSVAGMAYVHDIGVVWANMLHNVYAALVTAHGWSATARTNASTNEGNIVFLHHLVDALALQPCNPTFATARDAWIQADQNRYGGANKCLLWRTFASRGLGVGAANYVDSTAVPNGC